MQTNKNLELTSQIRVFCIETGFDLVGIAKAELPAAHEEALDRWIGEGHAGTMGYMAHKPHRRSNSKNVLPSVRSVISLAINYYHPEDSKPPVPAGKVAKYAYGRDYHRLIEKKLKALCRFLAEKGGPGTQAKSYVDTGPVLERAFAREAGLGFFGKNTNLITRDFGSWVFLASVLTNLELEYDGPHTGSCGSCRICVDACPTGALLGDYRLDARKCISYLTIEAKEEPPPALGSKMGEWIFGCDICQDVCPYNFRKKTTRHAELYPMKKAGTWIELEELEKMSQEEFAAHFQGSPIKRAKRAGMLRNAKNCLFRQSRDDAR